MEEVEETIGGRRAAPDEKSVVAPLLRCNNSTRISLGVRLENAVTRCTIRDRRQNRPRFVQLAQDQTMECTVNWLPASGMGFVAETGSGHVLVMDGAPDGGGRNLAPRPMETVLAGTAGCTAYDVVLILQRGRQAVSGCQVKVTSERAATDPKVFTRIHMHFAARRCPRRPSHARSSYRTRSTAPPASCSARRPRSRPRSRSPPPEVRCSRRWSS
jgi:uncharacterized OsmC-like protein